MSGIQDMKGSAVAILALSAVTLTALAIVTGYKNSGALGAGSSGGNVTNASADKFITGIAIFATFTAVIVLALVGKIIIGLFKG